MKQVREVFNTESFIKVSKRKYGEGWFDYSEVVYVRAKVKVKLRCKKHDLWFETTPDSHNRAPKNTERGVCFGGCPECRREVLGQYHRLSVEDFIKRSSEKHNNFYDYSKVVLPKNMHHKVDIVCPLHGSFHQTLTNHLHNGFGCTECANIASGLSRALSQEEVLNRFTERHGDLYGYYEVVYEGYYTPVRIYCKTHDSWFYQNPCDHFTGTGCKLCIDKGYSRNKSGYFYINRVSDDAAIKVGITNVCPIARAKVLNRKSSSHEIVNLFYFYHEDGNFIYNLESEVLSSFETGIIPKVEMESGYTETIATKHLPEIIDIVTLRFNQYPDVYTKPD